MNRTIIIIIGIVVLAGGFISYRYFRSANESPYQLATVQKGDLTQEVSASGKVAPPTTIDLQFKNSGKLTVLNAKVGKKVAAGQLLAKQDTGVLDAQLAEMQAGIDVQKAKLDQLNAGATPEDIQLAETGVTNAQQVVDDAKQNLVDKLQDAYTKADDAVRGKADQLFTNPQSYSPHLNFFVIDSSLQNDIEWSRLLIEGNDFRVWKPYLDQLTINSDFTEYASTTRKYLGDIKVFLDKLALALNNPNNMYVVGGTQATTPSNWKTDISTARTNVNTALSNLSAAEEKLKTAKSSLKTSQDQLIVKKAPVRFPDVALYEAQIRQAEAQMQKIQAQIQENILTAPASGVITEVNGNLGESIKSDAVVVRIIPTGVLQVDVNISEADIVGIKVGQEAKITLDAFGDQVSWPGKVSQIDPAETIVGGAIYYKTTVLFVDHDERIKPGMTTNVWIKSAHKEGVLYIPAEAVKEKRGQEPTDSRLYPYVQVLEGSQIKEKDVQTGMKGENGTIEIISGLNEGEQVILSTKTK